MIYFSITLGPIKAIVIGIGCIGAVLAAALAIAGVLTYCKWYRNKTSCTCKCYERGAFMSSVAVGI